jgi:hypothetical protein
MGRIWLPPESDLARAARGWPAPGVKPTGPVEINWSHPSTRGLKAYFPNSQTTQARDIVGLSGEPAFSGNAAITPQGLNFPAESDYVEVSRNWNLHGTSEITVALKYIVPGTMPNDTTARILGSNGSFIYINVRQFSGNTILNSGLYIAGLYRTNDVTVIGAVNAGDELNIFLRFDQPSLQIVCLFNGTTYSSTVRSFGAPIDDDAGDNIVFGADGEVPTNGTTGTIEYCAFYGRYFTDTNIARFVADEYGFLESSNQNPYLVSVPAGGGAGVTGDLSATEAGSDTASVSGVVEISGTVSASETGTDTAAVSGSALVSGDLAATETGSDVADINGSAPNLVTGDLAATETGSDVAAISGTLVVTGTLDVAEIGADSASVSGAVSIAGSLSATEAGADVADITGVVVPAGAGYISAQETGTDTAAVSGAVRVAGTLSVTEAGTDTAAISGSAPIEVSGTLDAFESGSDTAAVIGSVEISGTLTAVESGIDAAIIREREFTTGSINATETGSDTANVGGLIGTEYGATYQAVIDANYRIHGQNAVYKAGVDVSIVRVIIDKEEDLQGGGEISTRNPTYMIYVRSSQIAEPVRGAEIAVPGVSYTVDGYDPVSEWEWQLYART